MAVEIANEITEMMLKTNQTRWGRVSTTAALSTIALLAFGMTRLGLSMTIPTVPVENAGNAADGVTGHGFVAYTYRIGTYEVTNAQYAEFLNAKAAGSDLDPLFLYSDRMGGITRGELDGHYVFSVKSNMGDKPVTAVSWYDAIRFANWLHNGQGVGDTETGAYTLGALGDFATPINGDNIVRNPGAVWFLPSEDEWYKAAYYDQSLNGGAGDYWAYPTRSNSGPTSATINVGGDIGNPGANVANYWDGRVGRTVTTVGSAGPSSQSSFGTSDQGGNVEEWTEQSSLSGVRVLRGGNSRVLRGGSFESHFTRLASDSWVNPAPFIAWESIGFRVATVPEPSTAVMAIVGFALVIYWRWRHTVIDMLPER